MSAYRLALILAAAAAWVWPNALTTAVPLTTLTVRVYQTAGLSSMLEERALTEAETVLRAARVDVRWRRCTPRPSEACDGPPGPSDVLLRIAREGIPRQDRSAALGDALVIRHARGGVVATVYVNHVAILADVAEIDVAVLLGRVAAHELGHLMMQSATHARRGLMRSNWTPDEIRRNRAEDWTFTAEDVAAMRQPGMER